MSSKPIHEITWTVKHKHFKRLTQADFDELAASLRMPEGSTNDEILSTLYDVRDAEEVLAELATERTWLDDADAEMLLDNPCRTTA